MAHVVGRKMDRYPVIPIMFVENSVHFLLNYFDSFDKNQLTRYVYLLLDFVFSSVIYMSILMTIYTILTTVS